MKNLSDGKFELENQQSHLASMAGTHICMGPCAVFVSGTATLLITSKKTPPMDSPGLCAGDLKTLSYQHILRPLYPLDEIA